MTRYKLQYFLRKLLYNLYSKHSELWSLYLHKPFFHLPFYCNDISDEIGIQQDFFILCWTHSQLRVEDFNLNLGSKIVSNRTILFDVKFDQDLRHPILWIFLQIRWSKTAERSRVRHSFLLEFVRLEQYSLLSTDKIKTRKLSLILTSNY